MCETEESGVQQGEGGAGRSRTKLVSAIHRRHRAGQGDGRWRGTGRFQSQPGGFNAYSRVHGMFRSVKTPQGSRPGGVVVMFS